MRRGSSLRTLPGHTPPGCLLVTTRLIHPWNLDQTFLQPRGSPNLAACFGVLFGALTSLCPFCNFSFWGAPGPQKEVCLHNSPGPDGQVLAGRQAQSWLCVCSLSPDGRWPPGAPASLGLGLPQKGLL